MVGIIIVTHGEFGSYLLEACEHIVGSKQNIKSISIHNRMSMDEIKKTIKMITDEIRKECSGIIYLVDIPGGTPMNVVVPFAKEIENSYVICGVNMSMLIDAMTLKDRVSIDKLVEKIISDGKRSICEVKTLLIKSEGGLG
ncbi:MAG: hypothetical protein N2446_00970 [Elusimicrobiales bacterium]|nr:hypothetical protein [Elusimicrobiales bacterium]